MRQELPIRIVLQSPPAGVDFALQKGRGSDFETVQKQRSTAKDLSFEFVVALKADPKKSAPDFGGPFVQGPREQRFVYIDIGTIAGQKESCWSRRLKIPLSGITSEMVDQMSLDPRAVLEAHVPGTGSDGGPSCAAVKRFDGWKIQRPATA